MRVGYTIFPRSDYLLETFRGIVSYQDLARIAARQQLDVRIAPHYHTVADFSRATVRLTEGEVRLFADAICAPPRGRLGKRALVVVGARNLAFASLLQTFVVQYGLDAQCFCDREAAQRWLSEQRIVPAMNVNYLESAKLEAAVS
jgi:hypothetical protein